MVPSFDLVNILRSEVEIWLTGRNVKGYNHLFIKGFVALDTAFESSTVYD
jgi:hypothetical protein